jgi:hypothetical protein
MTLLFFWIPIPLLHWVGWEEFELPWGSWGILFVVCLTGAVYVSARRVRQIMFFSHMLMEEGVGVECWIHGKSKQ